MLCFISLILEGKAYLDKKEISQNELHAALRAGKMASTSQPSPGEVKELLEGYRKNDDQVILVSVWKNILGTYQSIKSVVDEYKETYPDFKLAVIDTKSGSVAGSIISMQIAEMIHAGFLFEEIVSQAKWNVDHYSIYLTVENLKWLAKSGRLSKGAGFIGSALKLLLIIKLLLLVKVMAFYMAVYNSSHLSFMLYYNYK